MVSRQRVTLNEPEKVDTSNSDTAPVNDEEQLSFKRIHDAIPAHLFERSTLKSFLYLAHDIALVAVIFVSTYFLVEKLLPSFLFWPTIIVYWIVQGTVATGIWVIAHECGHQAFSPSQTINDTVGLILHSFLLTPYHSWKISHALHHRSTGHMTRDMVFVPKTKKQYLEQRESMLSMFMHGLRVITGNGVQKEYEEEENYNSNASKLKQEDVQSNGQSLIDDEYLTDIPVLAFLVQIPSIILMLLFGWPSYLLFNVTGQKYERWTSHFIHNSPIFLPSQKFEVILSNLGLITMTGLIIICSYLFTFEKVFIYYMVPYLFVNAWLVLITYLHHTDPLVPHYRDGAWSYVKGALATIDRDYGYIINYLHHHIGDTHVAHHLFSRIPHYNATEVTQIIKPLLGKYYMSDDTFFLKALWINHLTCRYVPDEGEILYYERSATLF